MVYRLIVAEGCSWVSNCDAQREMQPPEGSPKLRRSSTFPYGSPAKNKPFQESPAPW